LPFAAYDGGVDDDIGRGVGQHSGRLLDFMVVNDIPTVSDQLIEEFLYRGFIERPGEPFVLVISFHNRYLIIKYSEKQGQLQYFQYLYENNRTLKHIIMGAKKNKDKRVLKYKENFNKNLAKEYKDHSISQRKIDRVEAKQAKYKSQYDTIDAGPDY
jgi:hypothetical protein